MPTVKTIGPNACYICTPPGGVTGSGESPGGGPCRHCHGTGFGPQYFALRSTADIIGYGGQAGGGKTWVDIHKPMIMGDIQNPSWHGIFFRRSRADLETNIWAFVKQWCAIFGGYSTERPMRIRFPSGAVFDFIGLDHPNDLQKFDGGAFPYVVFDEATQFWEGAPRFMFTRQRSTEGLRSQLILSTNPGGHGHKWYFQWFAPWLDPKFKRPAKLYEKRWYVGKHDDQGRAYFEWFQENGQLVDRHVKGARSVVFIPAALEDNIALMQNDPDYEERLKDADFVTYQWKRHGNWLITPGAGNKFRREWFQIIELEDGRVPQDLVRARVRYWDRAGTEADGDYTVGVRAALLKQKGQKGRAVIVIEDVKRYQFAPGKVDHLIQTTAQRDPRGTVAILEEDPGQAGVDQADRFLREMRKLGIKCRVISAQSRGSKAARADGASKNAWQGLLRLVRAPWNDDFIVEHTQFPDQCLNDDQVDAHSGAHDALRDLEIRGRYTIGRDHPKI